MRTGRLSSVLVIGLSLLCSASARAVSGELQALWTIGDADGQTGCVNESISFVSEKISEGNLEIVMEHG